jgi:hypothetical protein
MAFLLLCGFFGLVLWGVGRVNKAPPRSGSRATRSGADGDDSLAHLGAAIGDLSGPEPSSHSHHQHSSHDDSAPDTGHHHSSSDSSFDIGGMDGGHHH